MDFSEKVASAAWDADVPFEADLTFRRKVEPAVLAIEDAVRSNRYLAELLSRPFGRTATSAGGGIITLVVAQALSLPDI